MRHTSIPAMPEVPEWALTLLENAGRRSRLDHVHNWNPNTPQTFSCREWTLFSFCYIVHSTVVVFESICYSVILLWLLVLDRKSYTPMALHTHIIFFLFSVLYETNFLNPFICVCLAVSVSTGSRTAEWYYPPSLRVATSWVDHNISKCDVYACSWFHYQLFHINEKNSFSLQASPVETFSSLRSFNVQVYA